MAINHVFVDYQNIKAGNLDLLASDQFKAVIFLAPMTPGFPSTSCSKSMICSRRSTCGYGRDGVCCSDWTPIGALTKQFLKKSLRSIFRGD